MLTFSGAFFTILLSAESAAYDGTIDSVNLFKYSGIDFVRVGVTPDPAPSPGCNTDFVMDISGADGERKLSMLLVGLASNLSVNIIQPVPPQQTAGYCLAGGVRFVDFTIKR